MPRSNPPRAVFAEANLARRIAIERQRRGWTYEKLAGKLGDVDCTIQVSALHKIEKSDPPRRITVDELVAFSKVFGLPLNDLVADSSTLIPSRAFDLRERMEIALAAAFDGQRAQVALWDEWSARMREYTDFIDSHPEVKDDLDQMWGTVEQQKARQEIMDLEFAEARAAAVEAAQRALRTTETE